MKWMENRLKKQEFQCCGLGNDETITSLLVKKLPMRAFPFMPSTHYHSNSTTFE